MTMLNRVRGSRSAFSGAVVAAVLGAAVSSAPAVICIGPRQLVQPADQLTGGFAQYVGRFGNYVGVPISARHFVSSSHVGNAGGGTFFFRNGTAAETGYAYFVKGVDQDVTVYELNAGQPSFTLWAPIYNRTNEVGKALMLVGRGRDKGPQLFQAGNFIGWFWASTDDFALTWGTNTVNQTAVFGGPPGFAGDYLLFTFDQPAGPTEGIAALNDSTGPVFIVDPADGVAKLAAMVSGVDGGYSGTANGPQFSGALFDTRGLFIGPNLISGPNPIPINTYAARLSTRGTFLRGAAGVPPKPCPADLTGDRRVDTNDLVRFLGAFGSSGPTGIAGDVNDDGAVNTADLTVFLGQFGVGCP
ncbi:MAG: GC-type dockerin domain-anchored protein [Phycisphaerales bacterium]